MWESTVRIDKLGRVLIPASVRKQAGLEPNTRLVVRVHDGRVELMTVAAAVRMAQALVRRHVKAGAALADDLIRERRSEVRRETRRRR
jgi:AbrB family looped-hinge helix DNA binding protein